MPNKNEAGQETKPCLLGFGMSLLDIIIDGSTELLEKYGLSANGEVRASNDQLSIFQQVSDAYKDNLYYRPGGAVLNTVKVAQWCLGDAGSTAVISCVNDDSSGQTLRQAMAKAGVKPLFQVKPDAPTGSCLVICTGSNRSLVTYAGVSGYFTVDFFNQEEIQAAIAKSQFLYCSAYSLIGCFEGVEKLAVIASKDSEKAYSLNMGAVFVCQQYWERLKHILPFVDILFGNQEEAIAFSKACGLQASSIEEIALQLCGWTRAGEKRRSRIVVLTNGPEAAILCLDGQLKKFPPPSVPQCEIVDANGAGDAFVGGFLSSLMQRGTPEAAMVAGHEAAGVVLRQRGCDLPDDK